MLTIAITIIIVVWMAGLALGLVVWVVRLAGWVVAALVLLAARVVRQEQPAQEAVPTRRPPRHE